MSNSRSLSTVAAAVVSLAAPALLWLPSAVPSAAAPDTTTSPAVAASANDTFRLGGAVARPQRLTTASLQDYPQQTVTTTYTAQGVPTTKTFTGPLLLDVLLAAGPRFDTSRSNDQLAFAVRVGATDGYRAVVSWGEIDPGFAGTQVLLAVTEDGQPLERPRLVVPGDARGGRYVTDVSTVRLVDLGR